MYLVLVAVVLGILGYGFNYYFVNQKILQNPIVASVYNTYFPTANKYQLGNGLTTYVTTNDILAVICQESGAYINRGTPNSQIIGDNNKAFGVMQIHETALQQVNDIFGLNLSLSDIIESADNNIKAGACYLDFCFSQFTTDINQTMKAFAMYNGGSTSYASGVNNFLTILKGVS